MRATEPVRSQSQLSRGSPAYHDGKYPELSAAGLRNTGSENYGGATVTAGGLQFIGATVYDNKFHAYEKRTGKLL